MAKKKLNQKQQVWVQVREAAQQVGRKPATDEPGQDASDAE